MTGSSKTVRGNVSTIEFYWLAAVLIAISPAALGQAPVVGAAANDPLGEVTEMVRSRRFQVAKVALSEIIKRKPEGWRAVMPEGDKLVRAYWNISEFLKCSPTDGRESNKDILWRGPSYSQAYFLLAYVLQEEGDLKGALDHLNIAVALEPDSPTILMELGHLLVRSNPRAAVRHFERAQQRTCVGEQQLAAAYRGQGVVLVELGELDAAEQALKKSLELSPGNKNAESELRYIEGLRRGGRKGPIISAPSPKE